MTDERTINQLVDNLFRHESGRIVATLTRIFGVENMQLAEDVLQETLIKALQQWSYNGIPDNPGAWLMQVAKNHALDVLRRQSNYEHKLSLLKSDSQSASLEESINFDNQIEDDLLAMLFMGCHPALSPEMQITLLLKTVGGFSASEIARAFLIPEATVAQRIVRAKRKLRDEAVTFHLPDSIAFQQNLDAVLLVIYLIFSEGYKASEGNFLIRTDFCYEAIRLCEMVLKHPQGDSPQCQALMALMLLQASRLDTRVESDSLLLLADQDRTKWNQQAIELGLYHLEKSASGDSLSGYHLQAGIAACHATAPSYEVTDWEQILSYYDQLIQMSNSPFIQLNRLVALSFAENVKQAQDELKNLDGLDSYYLYHATLADFEYRLKNSADAIRHYERAKTLTANSIEKQFIEARILEMKENAL